MIRIGVVGIGHVGKHHLRKYAGFDNISIVAVADCEEERANEAAEQYQCLSFNDHRKMTGMVSAVSIAVPTSAHYEIARDFLEAGIDVLLEKPMTETLDQADELNAIARRNNLVFQIGFIERFNPAVLALERVASTPLFIEAHRLHPFFERGTDVDVILDLMIHDIDIVLYFTKSPLISVDAVGVPVMTDKIDICNARLKFQNGCVANITASRISTKSMQKARFFSVDGYNAVDYEKRELVSLSRVKNPQGRYDIIQNHGEIKMLDPLEEELRSFLSACDAREVPPVTGVDGRNALAVACLINDEMKTISQSDAARRPSLRLNSASELQ